MRRGLLLGGAAVAVAVAAAIVLIGGDEDDAPPERSAVEARAIRECVKATTSQFEGTPEEGTLDVEAYCDCYVPALLAGADRAESRAIVDRIKLGRPPDRAIPIASRCAAETGE